MTPERTITIAMSIREHDIPSMIGATLPRLILENYDASLHSIDLQCVLCVTQIKDTLCIVFHKMHQITTITVINDINRHVTMHDQRNLPQFCVTQRTHCRSIECKDAS